MSDHEHERSRTAVRLERHRESQRRYRAGLDHEQVEAERAKARDRMATRRARLRNIPKLNTSAAETKGDDPTITNDWLSAAMTDAELASADIYELIERRHCLTIGRTFDREDWERRRRAVEQFRASMAAENARIGIIAGGSAADASQRSEARL